MSRKNSREWDAVIVPRMIETVGLESHDRVIEHAYFHHRNLVLRLIHDQHFHVYRIDVLRVNDQSTHDMWGVFMEEADARRKFVTITL